MKDALSYIESLFGRDEQLEQMTKKIVDQGMPNISVPSGYGRLLTLLVRLSGAKRILEIGALGGISGIYLARGLAPDGQLVSLELDASYANLARQHLTDAGFGNQVTYMVGEATQSLRQLAEQAQTFDFFFIDADKMNYPVYLDHAIQLANPGALIAADNTLLKGKVYNAEAQGISAQAMRKFNEQIATDPRLISVMLPVYDGITLAIVK